VIGATLIELIEIHSRRLTADVVDDLLNNQRTRGFRTVRRCDLEPRVAELLHHLGNWIGDPRSDRTRAEFTEWGRRRFDQGIPLSELVFAIIPSPKGPVLARGAVMSYREFLQPSAERLTDEAWRSRLHDGSGPPRPRWLNALYTDAVGPVRPPKRFQDRCGPMSGSRIECL